MAPFFTRLGSLIYPEGSGRVNKPQVQAWVKAALYVEFLHVAGEMITRLAS